MQNDPSRGDDEGRRREVVVTGLFVEGVLRPNQSIQRLGDGRTFSFVDGNDQLDLTAEPLDVAHEVSFVSRRTDAGTSVVPPAIAPSLEGIGGPNAWRAGPVPDQIGNLTSSASSSVGPAD